MSSTLAQLGPAPGHLAELGRPPPDRGAAISPGYADLLRDRPWRRLFVKIDVQGAEPAVLAGHGGAWDRVQGVQLELALLPLYEGERPWLELVATSRPAASHPIWSSRATISRALGRQVQVDIVFYRSDLRTYLHIMAQAGTLGSVLPGDPPRGLAVHRDLLRVSLVLLGWLWQPLFWLGLLGDRLVRVLLPRSGASDADDPAIGRQPGRRRGGGDGRPRAAAGAGFGAMPLPCIGIFMNVFDVHVNRTPVAGRVVRRAHHAGKFLNASFDKASDENERQSFKIRDGHGREIGLGPDRGARGATDHRVRRGRVPSLTAGQRVGLIRFGSRCDVYLPAGRRAPRPDRAAALAGETVLADLGRQPNEAPGTRELMMLRHRRPPGSALGPAAGASRAQHAHHPRPVRRDDLHPLRARRARIELAVTLLLAAVVLDGLDGRSARMLNLTSKLGAELDSLADFLSFGVAPAVLTYLWTLHDVRGVGWGIAMLFATCCALRLARFNTELDVPDRPRWTHALLHRHPGTRPRPGWP